LNESSVTKTGMNVLYNDVNWSLQIV